MRTVLTSEKVQLVAVAAVLQMLYGDNSESLKSIRDLLLPIGAKLIGIRESSVSFVVRITSSSSLKQLWGSYMDGSLRKNLKKAINEIKELQELANGEEIDITLTIDEHEYHDACWDLVLAKREGIYVFQEVCVT